jgi:hypothetical protein
MSIMSRSALASAVRRRKAEPTISSALEAIAKASRS